MIYQITVHDEYLLVQLVDPPPDAKYRLTAKVRCTNGDLKRLTECVDRKFAGKTSEEIFLALKRFQKKPYYGDILMHEFYPEIFSKAPVVTRTFREVEVRFDGIVFFFEAKEYSSNELDFVVANAHRTDFLRSLKSCRKNDRREVVIKYMDPSDHFEFQFGKSGDVYEDALYGQATTHVPPKKKQRVDHDEFEEYLNLFVTE
jgi:hypothetical protein